MSDRRLRSVSGATSVQELGMGWGDYVDSEHTEASPQLVAADTPTVLSIDGLGAFGRTAYEPTGVPLFDTATGAILGRTGDVLGFNLDFVAVPTNQATTDISTSIDIQGGVGEIYNRLVTFPKGTGNPRFVLSSTLAYTLDTWETNGGTPKIISPNTVSVYAKRIVVFRLMPGPGRIAG